MKRMIFIWVCVLCFLGPNFGFSKENYFQARYGNELNSSQSENYFILENNSLANWAFGAKIIALNNGLTVLVPRFFWKSSKEIQLGVAYCRNSLDSKSLGPSFRFIKTMGPIFVFLDSVYYFDLNKNNNKLDIWLHLSSSNKNGWYCGAEFWYYDFQHGLENFHFRPLKIGYRTAKYLSPFVMIERKWIDWKEYADKVYLGFEVKY